MINSTLKHYKVEALLGQGGMGAVYRARDTLLDRTVAIKVLAVGEADAAKRLLHEARAASALNHPNSVTVHAVEQDGDTSFIVMEYVEGTPLDRLIPAGGMPIGQLLEYGCAATDALAAAHEQGLVHRDIKPGNVMIGSSGRVKVLDFGIARRTALPEEVTRALTLGGTISPPGAVVGTVGYLAPEQVVGQPADARSDVFSVGALLYELTTGVRPFTGPTPWAVLEATMRRDPAPMATLRADVPPALSAIVTRCLSKDPADRFASAREVCQALTELRQTPSTAVPDAKNSWRVPIAIGCVVAVAAIGALSWSRAQASRLRWARDTAVPEISRLVGAGDPVGAYRLAQRALAAVPNDPVVEAAWVGATQGNPIVSEPPGAEVQVRSLSGASEDWVSLGTTPISTRIPLGQMRWRFSKAGFEPREVVPSTPLPQGMRLTPEGQGKPGMVLVPAGEFFVERHNTTVALPEFWIDQFEVTNRQYKAFVDQGGYRKREYWTQPFVKGRQTVTWEDAMAAFKDGTGQPGPATWELGTYPDGQDDWPVSGVSWYEAAAYAAFAGKSLPTTYHWYQASGAFGAFSEILRFSNFNGRGTVKVGVSGGLGPYGTSDMAGNVKEWTWNETEGGRRFILGGGYPEATYQFHDEDARLAFDRDPAFGFRCMVQADAMAADLLQPIVSLQRNVDDLKPVGDQVYEGYRRLYDYDDRPLEARVESRDDTSAHWITERVSFRAAYGTERVPMLLFLPRSATPPYQVLLYFPGSDAVRAGSSRTVYMQYLEFLMRSGRAVAFPIYQQTYERRRDSKGMNFLREISIQRGQDVRRAIDYLATRSDIDLSRLSFYGLSLGAQLGPVYLAVEPRLKAGVLLSGGFETWTVPPETEPVNFAPRVNQPVLMVNGREDFDLPLETAQLPLFRALGTPATEKRHVILEGGHLPPRPQEVFKEILTWLDQRFGPVTTRAAP